VPQVDELSQQRRPELSAAEEAFENSGFSATGRTAEELLAHTGTSALGVPPSPPPPPPPPLSIAEVMDVGCEMANAGKPAAELPSEYQALVHVEDLTGHDEIMLIDPGAELQRTTTAERVSHEMIDVGPDDIDMACSTLLTTVFLLWAAPTIATSRPMMSLVLVLAIVVFTAQLLFTIKLVGNASDPNEANVREQLIEGWLDLRDVQCSDFVNMTVRELPPAAVCRLAMADMLRNEFDDRRSSGESTDIQDLTVCLTDDGLTNGAVNMVAGMLIVSATVLLGLVEQISGVYAIPCVGPSRRRSTHTLAAVFAMIAFHVGLACTLLVAARRRIVTEANGFWGVMEASVTVFLVTELDDLVLYCVKRHPVVQRVLAPLRVQQLDAAQLVVPGVSPCTGRLLVPARAAGGRPAPASPFLFQPMVWVRTAVDLLPYQYSVEWICLSATFGLMGDARRGRRTSPVILADCRPQGVLYTKAERDHPTTRTDSAALARPGEAIIQLVRMGCRPVEDMSARARLVETLSVVLNLTGNISPGR
jgi:hypothetical protein